MNRFSWTDAFVLKYGPAKEFYEQLFGWYFADQHDDLELVYSLACLNSEASPPESISVAGLAECKDPSRKMDCWNSYIRVQNVDGMVERIQSFGGTLVMGPMDVMTAGRMAVCLDSRGAAFHLWQAKDHQGVDSSFAPGKPCWFELTSAHIKSSIEFYSSVFGWTVREAPSDSGQYHIFYSNDIMIAGMHNQIDHSRGTETWLPFFLTQDMEASVKKCLEFNGSVIHGPVVEPKMGKYATVTDLENNMFGLAQFN